MELPRLWIPKLPPPIFHLGKLGCFTGLGAPGTDGREGDGGRALPDITVHPCGLDGVVTPVVPTITPVLTMVGDGGGGFGLRILKQGGKLGVAGQRQEPIPPGGGEGLGADEGFEDEVVPVGEDTTGPSTRELAQAPPTTEGLVEGGGGRVTCGGRLGRLPYQGDLPTASCQGHKYARLGIKVLFKA
jgi:hypothetical protein